MCRWIYSATRSRNAVYKPGAGSLHQFEVSLRAAAETGELERLWRDLEMRAEVSFFLSWDWIGCWVRESGVSPLLLMVRHGGQVVALALLQPSRRRGGLLIGIDRLMLHQAGDAALDDITIEHNDILADRAVAGAAKQACIAFLVRSRREPVGWDELHLAGLSSAEAFRPIAEGCGLTMSYRAHSQSWVVDLEQIRGGGGAYLDQLSANTRYQIRRAVRLYRERGELTMTVASSVEEALAFFTELKLLHQRYWIGRGRRGLFCVAVLRAVPPCAADGVRADRGVEIVRVASGGEPIGYLYNLIRDGWVCAYQSGFSYEADAKLKPGLVSHSLCIERHLQQGHRRYDFLAGGDRYKASLGRAGPDIATVVLQRPLLKLKLENAARSVKRRFSPAGAVRPNPLSTRCHR